MHFSFSYFLKIIFSVRVLIRVICRTQCVKWHSITPSCLSNVLCFKDIWSIKFQCCFLWCKRWECESLLVARNFLLACLLNCYGFSLLLFFFFFFFPNLIKWSYYLVNSLKYFVLCSDFFFSRLSSWLSCVVSRHFDDLGITLIF